LATISDLSQVAGGSRPIPDPRFERGKRCSQ